MNDFANLCKEMKNNDTPQTDAFRASDSLLESWEDEWELAISFARELEKKLATSQAEVERLRRTLKFIDTDRATHDCTGFYRGIAFRALNPHKKHKPILNHANL